jgi:exportin-5
VRLRWEELSVAERNEFANLTINLLSEVIDPREEWALKSQTAALVAEVIIMCFFSSTTFFVL